MASEDKKETVAETKEVKEETTPTENSKSETKDKDIDTSAPPAEPAPPKPTVKKVNYEKDVVYLYQFPRTSVIPSISPYCLKVETWLRLAGLKYEVRYFLFGSTTSAEFLPHSVSNCHFVRGEPANSEGSTRLGNSIWMF